MHETLSTNYLASFVTWGGPPSHRLRRIPTYSAKRIAIVREAVIKVVTPYVPLSIHDETLQKNTKSSVYILTSRLLVNSFYVIYNHEARLKHIRAA